jgi:hypothetical protein
LTVPKKSLYVACGLSAVLGVLICLGAYARIWEERQPKQYVSKAEVRSIEKYRYTNDLHWSSRGYRVNIVGEDKAIDFSSKNWDNTVEVGDNIDAVVRRSFPWFGLKDELDGLSIDDHK